MKRILIFTSAMILVIGTAAFAQPGHGMGKMHGGGPCGPGCMMHDRPGPGHGGCNVMMCSELELTDDQKDKIKDLMFNHHQVMIDLKATLEKAQLNMRHQMHDDSPDKAKALEAARMVNAARGKMAEAKINHRFAVRDVLTAEQLETWQNCRGKCGGHRGMGMCCGDRPGMDRGEGKMSHRRDGSCMKGK